jgi:glycosyltransferase involved in cell wall biosynthesis
MRILYLTTWYPYPADNGSKIRVYHLLRALGTRHRVTLLSFAFGTSEPGQQNDLHRFCTEVQAIPVNPFERKQILPGMQFLSLQPVVTRPVPAMSRAVQDTLARTSFDVAIASTEVTATYALRTPDATTKVLEEHNSLTRWMWERYREQKSALQRLRCWVSWQKTRHYEARLFRKFDLCVMVSEPDRRASMQMLPGYRGPMEVVPNGVDCQRNAPGLAPPMPNSLVFNGSLTYYANYEAMRYFLTDVFPLIRQKVPGVSLTITGSTSGVNLAGLPLDGNVNLSGYVDDVRPLVAGAWVCVVPIRQGSGTRLKILEAMALGTPVVATAKGAEGLDVTDGEHILLADEPEAFAERTLQLLGDAALRRRLAANARRLVEERYDWEQIGRRFVSLVEGATHIRRERL